MADQVNTLSPDRAWTAALGELEHQMTKATFNTWLKDSRLVSYKNGAYTIGVRNVYAKDWLENRMGDVISSTLFAIDPTGVRVEYAVLDGDTAPVLSSGDAELSAAAIASVWPDAMMDYAARQTAVQPRDCLRLLRKVEWLWAGTKLQVWCSDHDALTNLERMDKNWPDGLQASLASLATPVPLQLIGSPSSNGAAASFSANGSGKRKGGRKPPSDTEPSIDYRNIRPPTDPLGSFVKISHYAVRFWRPFLGPILFDLLHIISDYDYEVRVLHKPGPKMNDLHRKLGHGDIYDLVGRKASSGRAGKYGWINELRDHNLCHHIQVGRGRGAKHYFDSLTLIENLPLLTPKQVEKLDPKDQEEHREWLEMHTSVSYDEWLADSRETRIPSLPVRTFEETP